MKTGILAIAFELPEDRFAEAAILVAIGGQNGIREQIAKTLAEHHLEHKIVWSERPTGDLVAIGGAKRGRKPKVQENTTRDDGGGDSSLNGMTHAAA